MLFGRIALLALLAASTCNLARAQQENAHVRFEVSLPDAQRAQPVTGRLFLMMSKRADPEVRLQSTWFNSPEIVAVNVSNLLPGQAAVVDGTMLGTPLRSMDELPPGDYYVQAVLNVYTQFQRADGHKLWAHMDRGEGQQFNLSPGNLFSKATKLHLERSGTFHLSLTETIPPLPEPLDTPWVKHIRVQSQLLTRFWGHPIYLGAVVLLPREYASRPATHYPVIYYQPEHFRSFPPFEFSTDATPEPEALRRHRRNEGFESGFEFNQAWSSDNFPRMIAVSLQTTTPLCDWSGAVDSANNGPYDQAIMTELIPAIETQFRIIRQPYARVLTGKHSGGRAALALQLHHAEFFGGAWILHPWPFNFQRWTTLDIYANDNAYLLQPVDLPEGLGNLTDWIAIDRPIARNSRGLPFVTVRQLSQHDSVMAGMAAGDPIGADDVILGPVGDDGYPQPLWDRASGRINRQVADYWREHGDLAYFTRQNWSRIGAHLAGKLHIYIGDADVFYREEGVKLFEEFLRSATNPRFEGTIEYDHGTSSRQPMNNAELVRMMAAHITARAPPGADTRWMQP